MAFLILQSASSLCKNYGGCGADIACTSCQWAAEESVRVSTARVHCALTVPALSLTCSWDAFKASRQAGKRVAGKAMWCAAATVPHAEVITWTGICTFLFTPVKGSRTGVLERFDHRHCKTQRQTWIHLMQKGRHSCKNSQKAKPRTHWWRKKAKT